MRSAFNSTLLALAILAFRPLAAVEFAFPADANILDVKRDFAAVGDGKTDDTKAIMAAVAKALSGDRYNPKFIYLPKGTYLVSDTIQNRIREGGWSDGWLVGITLIGQSRDRTIIKLQDNCPGYGDAKQPKSVLRYGSENHSGDSATRKRPDGGGNEGFRNNLINCTIDVGAGNPGALALSYVASNRGTVEEVTLRGQVGSGLCGLDLTTWWPGPALITHVTVEGFDYGLRQQHMDCSMTYEFISLSGQRVCAIEGIGEPFMSLRKVTSRNAVPFMVIHGRNAVVNLLDSEAMWTGTGTPPPAISAECHLVLKNVSANGYAALVADPGGKVVLAPTPDKGVATTKLWTSSQPLRLSDGPIDVPDLPVQETPTFHHNDFTKWANPQNFSPGSRTAGIQEAIDSGAEIIYLPNGYYPISETIIMRGKVRKLMGCEAVIDVAKDAPFPEPFIRYDGGPAAFATIEHLMMSEGGIVEHNSAKTLALRKCELRYRNTALGTGDVFFEDGMFRQSAIRHPQRMWARQFNGEFTRDPQLLNVGGTVWILGMKVEGDTSAIVNLGGVVECYALYSMTGSDGKQPFVDNREGRIAVSFRDGGQKQFHTKIREVWDGVEMKEDSWTRERCLHVGGRPFAASDTTPNAAGVLVAKPLVDGSVELRWSAASPGSLPLRGYAIYRGKALVGMVSEALVPDHGARGNDDAKPVLPDADRLVFIDRDLTEGSSVTWTVTAVDLRGGVSKAQSATATVPADTAAPSILRSAIPGTCDCIQLDFSEPMSAAASEVRNYRLEPSVAIAKAQLSQDGTRVSLITAQPLRDGQSYVVTCSGLKDHAKASNPLAKPTATVTAWAMGSGLRLEFWNDKGDFAGKPVVTTQESRVDHWWDNKSPADGVNAGAFCARWSGVLRPKISGEYAFRTGVVRQCRIWLDGKIVHDQWITGRNEWTDSAPLRLEAGKHYGLVFEMRAVDGYAGARLKWRIPGLGEQFIDKDYLFAPTP